MATLLSPALSPAYRTVIEGLSNPAGKRLPSYLFYDDLGSALFEAITQLPEYGLTRADERLLQTYAPEIAHYARGVAAVGELGSGSGKKTRYLLESLRHHSGSRLYQPIDVSPAALAFCAKEVGDVADVQPVCSDWIAGLEEIARARSAAPFLLLFLGSSIGNLERGDIPRFLSLIRANLRAGDFFLLGVDLVKDIDTMLAAYDDPTGVTAAFNLNILGRLNRELNADFDLRSFAHEVRWNERERRIEMHLLSGRAQSVTLTAIDLAISFEAGETIWTESSHKFSEDELRQLADNSGFKPVQSWTDREWPFTEALWQAV